MIDNKEIGFGIIIFAILLALNAPRGSFPAQLTTYDFKIPPELIAIGVIFLIIFMREEHG